MRFIVYGAGAIGGTLGALLFRAGHDVTLIARGRHLEAIRSKGLVVVESASGSETYEIPAVSSPAEIDHRPGDTVLLTMKSQDTEAALRELAATRGTVDPTAIVCVQNAVVNEPLALRYFGDVYGVCVMFPATHLEPGVVQANCAPVPAILDIGRYPTGVDGTAGEIAAAFRSAGCHSEPRADIMPWKYAKLLMNLGNTPQAILGFGDGIAPIVERARAEGRAALEAAGIPYVSEEQDRERRGDILRGAPIAGRSRSGGSSWQSLTRASGSIEADYLAGEIVLLGRLHGVPTPVNELACRIAGEFVREGRPPGSLSAEDFLARLQAREPTATTPGVRPEPPRG